MHCLGLKQFEMVERAAIGVNETGSIVFVAKNEEETLAALKTHQSHTIVDLGSKFITPGFVDTHCHAPQYVFCGTCLEYGRKTSYKKKKSSDAFFGVVRRAWEWRLGYGCAVVGVACEVYI